MTTKLSFDNVRFYNLVDGLGMILSFMGGCDSNSTTTKLTANDIATIKALWETAKDELTAATMLNKKPPIQHGNVYEVEVYAVDVFKNVKLKRIALEIWSLCMSIPRLESASLCNTIDGGDAKIIEEYFEVINLTIDKWLGILPLPTLMDPVIQVNMSDEVAVDSTLLDPRQPEFLGD